MESQSSGADRLSVVAGFGAAALGALMIIGGLGLVLAVASSPQSRLQSITAILMTVVGAVNLWSSRKVWRGERPAAMVSAIFTTTLMAYFGAALRDFGEPFWIHGAYVLLLLCLWLKPSARFDHPAQPLMQ
jgi:uncharacterized membrane protein